MAASATLYRARFLIDLNISEGWNAYNALAILQGRALYPPRSLLIANNYPPLSFYVLAAVTPLFDNAVFAGRASSTSAKASRTGAAALVIGAGAFGEGSLDGSSSHVR